MDQLKNTTLKDVMHDPVFLSENIIVRDAVKVILNRDLKEVVVTGEGEKPVGLITKSDLVRHIIHSVSPREKTEAYKKRDTGKHQPILSEQGEQMKIGEIMSPKIFSLSEESSLWEAMEFMNREGFERMCVHGEDGVAITGIVNAMNIIDHLLSRPS